MTHIFKQLEQHDIRSIDLGFAVYAIKTMEELPDDEWAHTDTDLHEICLRHDLDDGPAREFLMHEITHCVLEMCGYTSEDESKTYTDTNEDMTIKLSRAWLCVIRLNPMLFLMLSCMKDKPECKNP